MAMKLRPSHPAGQPLGPLAEQVHAVPAQGGAAARHPGHRCDAARPGRRGRGSVRRAAGLVIARRGATSPRRCAAWCRRRAHRRRPVAAQLPADRRCPVLVHPAPRAVLGELAATVYGHPSDRRCAVIGVTGTSGKTTTTYLVEAGLRAADRVAGLIGTVGIRIDGRDVPSALTTPEAPDAAGAAGGDGRARRGHRGDGGVQPRADPRPGRRGELRGRRIHQPVPRPPRLPPDAWRTTSRPRRGCSTRSRRRTPPCPVVCVDDDAGRAMAARAYRRRCRSAPTARTRDWRVEDVRAVGRGAQEFVAVDPAGVHHGLRIALPGRYNVANCLLAVALLDAVGVSPEQAAPGLRTRGRAGPAGVGRPRSGLPGAGRLRAQAGRAAGGAGDAA